MLRVLFFSLTTHLVRGLAIQVVSVGIWALMVYKGLEASELCWAWVCTHPASCGTRQKPCWVPLTSPIFFVSWVFSRGFNIGPLLPYYLFKRDLILNTLFFILSAVIPALKDSTGLKLSNVKIISYLKNSAFWECVLSSSPS